MSDDRITILARADLQRTDWKLFQAMERYFAGDEWCNWRDVMRDIASHPEGHEEPLPPEPPFGEPGTKLAFIRGDETEEQCQIEPPPPAEDATKALTEENAALKAKVAELEDEVERLKADPPSLLPDPATTLLEHDESFRPIRALMEDNESVMAAKKRLYPLLMEELQDLKNQEALFDRSLPRRAQVEQLLGILARIGEH